jgi:hypothetical protein
MALHHAFSNARWKIVEGINFLAVNPHFDPRCSQCFDERIDLCLIASRIADKQHALELFGRT